MLSFIRHSSPGEVTAGCIAKVQLIIFRSGYPRSSLISARQMISNDYGAYRGASTTMIIFALFGTKTSAETTSLSAASADFAGE